MQRFPFNTKTPIGFSVAFVLQYLLLINLLIIPKCFYLIGIAILPMLFSLIDDTKRELVAIQESLRDRKKRKKNTATIVEIHSIPFGRETVTFDFASIASINHKNRNTSFRYLLSDGHVNSQTFGKLHWCWSVHMPLLECAVFFYWSKLKRSFYHYFTLLVILHWIQSPHAYSLSFCVPFF